MVVDRLKQDHLLNLFKESAHGFFLMFVNTFNTGFYTLSDCFNTDRHVFKIKFETKSLTQRIVQTFQVPIFLFSIFRHVSI
ncbi:hypothetical protein D3C87_1702780 [compost metagenome]